jgi:hypothetical protein
MQKLHTFDSPAAVRDALAKGKLAGVILWRGASYFDDSPVVYVATKFRDNSANEKTGGMVQTFILPDPIAAGVDVNGKRPAKIVAWLKATGAKSICGDCPHAWQYNESTGQYGKGTCYVREYQAPAAVLGAIARRITGESDSYAVAGVDFPESWIPELGRGRDVRLGSYGDPAAVPAAVSIDFVKHAAGRTGYTHFWKSANARARSNALALSDIVMASADSPVDVESARALGYRAFFVVPHGSIGEGRDVISNARKLGATLCPASKEFEIATGRRTNCQACGICSGATGKGANARDVLIPDHSATKGVACPAVAGMLSRLAIPA